MELLTDTTFKLALMMLIFGIIFSIIIYRMFFKKSIISERIQNYVLSQTQKIKLRRDQEFDDSLYDRTVGAFMGWLGKLLSKFTPAEMTAETNRKLAVAGYPYNMKSPEYFSFRLFVFVAAILLSVIIYANSTNVFQSILFIVILLILAFLIPNYWLSSKVRNRQDMIQKELPDVLDLLSVCAAAGLGFDQSLLRVHQYMTTPFGDEIGRVIAEMEIGISRANALRNMATRLKIQDVSSFISVIVQSDTLGFSIADTIHQQAEQMRIRDCQ
jgi:tight adherence protein C